ncbi:hypothetical protein HanPSC8_Chr03g0112541 [Helianthus annuus]|nr:hypothetical protein HanPSC8_Chr03g0112541 [Helianthus annuus]
MTKLKKKMLVPSLLGGRGVEAKPRLVKLRSLYKFSPEIKKTPEKGVTFSEAAAKRPKITIKSTDTAAQDAAKAAEAQ